MKYEILIELRSDLCASSGDSFGSLIDRDICYDTNGIPYIPAKRIKGILREEAEEYCNWREDSKKYINGIFGVEGSKNSGKLKIDNAYVNNYEKIVDEIKQIPENYEKYLNLQRILEIYTYTRYQTAIDEETGGGKDNSLRSTRIVKKGIKFISEISIDAEEEEINFLKNVIKLVSHMGLNRTRGYGEVKCKMRSINEIDNNNNTINIDSDDEKEIEIKLLLKAESEIMVAKQNAQTSQNYIPGSNILGNIARKYIEDKNITNFENMDSEFINLFLDGKVKYSNAYISNKAGMNFYPIPFSYTKVKNTSNQFYNKMFDVNEEDVQLSSITDRFVTLDENNYMKEVEIVENYHHQRGKDKSIGHITANEDGGTLYQYSAINKGQYFVANITGKAKYLKNIIKYIQIDDILRVGKSKNIEYGKLKIKDIAISESERTINTYKKFAAIFTSDVIIRDNVQTTTNKQILVKKLQDLLGENIELDRAFINYEKVSGYNIIWNLPKEQLEAFKAGSVLVFNSKEGINAKENYAIGIRKNEGYGNIKIIDISNKEAKINLKEDEEILERKELGELLNVFVLLKKSIENAIVENILEQATNINQEIYKLNNTTIGRLLLMRKQSKTFEEFLENVDSIKDNKKLDNVKKLLKSKREELLNMDSIKDLSRLNQELELNEFEQIGNEKIYIEKGKYQKFILEYVKQVLIQLKIGENK